MAGCILELRGCTPEPLGNHLKDLCAFRLIAEQADPQARLQLQHQKMSLSQRLSS